MGNKKKELCVGMVGVCPHLLRVAIPPAQIRGISSEFHSDLTCDLVAFPPCIVSSVRPSPSPFISSERIYLLKLNSTH